MGQLPAAIWNNKVVNGIAHTGRIVEDNYTA